MAHIGHQQKAANEHQADDHNYGQYDQGAAPAGLVESQKRQSTEKYAQADKVEPVLSSPRGVWSVSV